MADLLTAVTTYGRGGGSARVRVFSWTDRLRDGATVSDYLGGRTNAPAELLRHPARVLSAERRLRRLAGQNSSSPLLISRQASPFSNGGIESRLLRSSVRGVYDFDDALPYTPPRAIDRLWSKRRVWERSVRASDVVIAGNDFLAELASSASSEVVVIPSCIEPGEYVVKQDYSIDSAHPVAVWLGSPSTEAHLLSIETALLRAHEATGLRVKLISAGQADLGGLESMVDRVEWNPSTVAEELAAADFGIMPLPDSLWNRGKCGYKLLQYAATGLPLVGSPVGVNATILSRADGLAASNASEWTDALVAICDESESSRSARGRTALDAAVTQYSYDSWESEWLAAVGL
ncbi:glycosyltransferase [Leifsonia sp. PS1209]|uniref:glycosyltransferase n=1 Tax=Leifsonia sp. PS1209 TaxID=2724914 RepID=UPI001442B725|nr:glycosyltransferase [Leifsonia sp. PS1209]QIZ99611.1 glycosyltransferase family 4 protein [Leifsonia sp. PS1209]